MSDQTPASKQRRPDRAAYVIAAGLAVLAIVIAWSTSRMTVAGNQSQLGPTAFPYAIAAALFILAIATVVSASRGDFPEREREAIGPVVWIVGGLVAQMLLFKLVGFSVATGLLFAATAKGFGRGPLWMTVPIGIVVSFIVWFIFAKGLQLSLPAGPFERLF